MAFAIVNLLLALSPLTPESHAGYALSVSTSPYRTSPTALAGAVVSGPIYVFSSPSTGVTGARFYLDDPTMSGLPRQIEKNPPFDFAGGNTSVANAFDTSKISAGTHTITAALRLSSGATTVVSATFSVQSKTLALSPTPTGSATLLLSSQADRSSPRLLAGTTVARDIFVFLGSVSAKRVRYYVDDPGMSRSPFQTELYAPFDLAGGTAAAAAPFDTRRIADGAHTVTAAVDISTGGTAVVNANFTVSNGGTTGSSGTSSSAPALLLSSQANRSSPVPLAGATVSQNIFVFLGSVAAKRVRFYVDDPGMSRSPVQTELSAPYDLAGGTVETAAPFDTRRIADGAHTVTAAVDLSGGGTTVVSTNFTVSNGSVTSSPAPSQPSSSGRTAVSIHGNRFYINDVITYRGTPAEGLLMNARMVNSVFEDTTRSDFDPEANTDEFIRAMPDYVAHGVLGFTVSLQGGNPSYEGAVNTAFRSDGSLKSTYLARVKRVIQAADSLGAVVILSLFYQRQDQHLANADAVQAGVVNAMRWITNEGFGNVVVEIANEYNWPGFDHSIINTTTGMTSLINLAKATAPHVSVSASAPVASAFGEPYARLAPDVAKASDYLLIHGNDVDDSTLATAIDALKSYGKPIVINEDPSESVGARRARLAVQHGASWGLFLRKNQAYPFTFGGSADAPDIYDMIWSLTH
jgi:hypothetical protein